MKSRQIFCVEAASDDELEEIGQVLQMIEEDYNVSEMMAKKKVMLQDYDKLNRAMNNHFLKCTKDTCTIPQFCQKKHLDDSTFSQLSHLPFPAAKRNQQRKFQALSRTFRKGDH